MIYNELGASSSYGQEGIKVGLTVDHRGAQLMRPDRGCYEVNIAVPLLQRRTTMMRNSKIAIAIML